MVKKTIPKKVKVAVKNYIKELKEDRLPIQKVILYGSYAKGRASKWSDIDICVISQAFRKKDALEYLWKMKTKKDIKAMISPVGFHPKDFIDESPLVWEIKKTGKEIKL